MNLNYSANIPHWNQTWQLSDLAIFCPCTNRSAGPADVIPVAARRSRRSWPFANYRLRESRACFSLGLWAAVRPTQMLTRMKWRDCAVSALWPTECAFRVDSAGGVHFSEDFPPMPLCWTSIYSLRFTRQFILGYDMDTAWNVIPAHCCFYLQKEKVAQPPPLSILQFGPTISLSVPVTIHAIPRQVLSQSFHLLYVFAKMLQASARYAQWPGQEVKATRAQSAGTWRAHSTSTTPTFKTVWGRSCQVCLSTPLFQQTWQAL